MEYLLARSDRQLGICLRMLYDEGYKGLVVESVINAKNCTFYESWQCCNLLGGDNYGSICGIHQAAKGKRRFGF